MPTSDRRAVVFAIAELLVCFCDSCVHEVSFVIVILPICGDLNYILAVCKHSVIVTVSTMATICGGADLADF